MDWLQFISSVVGSLAWPGAAVLIVFFFRDPLKDRLPGLSKVTLPGGVSAEFERRIEEVEAAVTDSPPAETEITPPLQSTNTLGGDIELSPISVEAELVPLDRLALRANPTGVIMESWKELEAAMRLFAKASFPEEPIPRFFNSLSKLLSSRGKVSEVELESLIKLKGMRNLAAHSPNAIPIDDAKRFKELANLFIIAFQIRAKNVKS